MYQDEEIDRAIRNEGIRLDSPLEYEDNQFLNDIDKGYVGFTQPQVQHTELTPIERLQAIQGDWPEADYLPDDSGMTVGDLE